MLNPSLLLRWHAIWHIYKMCINELIGDEKIEICYHHHLSLSLSHTHTHTHTHTNCSRWVLWCFSNCQFQRFLWTFSFYSDWQPTSLFLQYLPMTLGTPAFLVSYSVFWISLLCSLLMHLWLPLFYSFFLLFRILLEHFLPLISISKPR